MEGTRPSDVGALLPDEISCLQLRPHDVSELFLRGEFPFQIRGEFRLELVGRDADGVRLAAEGVFRGIPGCRSS
jgi:hypothetical protein